MKYTILVSGPCFGTQNSISSFLFSKHLIKKGHFIKSIFFYSDGVYNSNSINFSDNEKINLLKCWKKLHKKFNINLKLCIGSALKRGLVNKDIALERGVDINNIDYCFKITGFTELSEDIMLSDRVIQF
ncbi:sulfurtransferase complex subunit TusD [Buchnera aphidicola (Astegopteryx bambusae)]|uniref:sulfurtransferase complex subunit TusD n=1 Tax=Buchnera aphidicola TaxID=9 RepID=UPI0031B84ACE